MSAAPGRSQASSHRSPRGEGCLMNAPNPGFARPPEQENLGAAVERQRGAALLLAMMTVALVATLAATALWQQWRGVEIESRERERLQAS